MPKLLEGVKILDFTRVLAGPYCSLMLGDMGAEIIKLEPPKGDDSRYFGPPYIKGEAIYYMSINRNKKSIVVNLKSEKGRNIIKKLIKRMDVVIENYRPGTMEKLGLGYDELKKINPKLIYAAISGYGHTGPDKLKPGYDMIAQAQGGLMSITSHKKNGPCTRVGVSQADLSAGMYAAFAIAARLFRRTVDGKGDKIDVSMLDCQVAMLTPMIANYLNVGKIATPVGNRHPLVSPFDVFKTKDKEVVITAGNDKLFYLLCDVLKMPKLKKDKRFISNPQRVANHDTLIRILQKSIKAFTARELLNKLDKAGVPACLINTVKETVNEPQVIARNMLTEITHKKTGKFKTFGVPIKLNSSDDKLKLPAPLLGEHTKEVLKKYIKIKDKEINELLKDKVIK